MVTAKVPREVCSHSAAKHHKAPAAVSSNPPKVSQAIMRPSVKLPTQATSESANTLHRVHNPNQNLNPNNRLLEDLFTAEYQIDRKYERPQLRSFEEEIIEEDDDPYGKPAMTYSQKEFKNFL